MTDREKIKIYNKLRGLHKEMLLLLDKKMPDWERNALETLSGTFYLTEGIFSEMSE